VNYIMMSRPTVHVGAPFKNSTLMAYVGLKMVMICLVPHR